MLQSVLCLLGVVHPLLCVPGIVQEKGKCLLGCLDKDRQTGAGRGCLPQETLSLREGALVCFSLCLQVGFVVVHGLSGAERRHVATGLLTLSLHCVEEAARKRENRLSKRARQRKYTDCSA